MASNQPRKKRTSPLPTEFSSVVRLSVTSASLMVKTLKAWEDYCDGERPLAGAMKRLGKV